MTVGGEWFAVRTRYRVFPTKRIPTKRMAPVKHLIRLVGSAKKMKHVCIVLRMDYIINRSSADFNAAAIFNFRFAAARYAWQSRMELEYLNIGRQWRFLWWSGILSILCFRVVQGWYPRVGGWSAVDHWLGWPYMISVVISNTTFVYESYCILYHLKRFGRHASQGEWMWPKLNMCPRSHPRSPN